MRSERSFPKFTVTAKGERWAGTGHPWIYASDVAVSPEGVENGALADVVGPKGKYLGTGLVSLASRIRVRILSRNANDRFDEAFWERRVRWAWDYRKAVMGGDTSACRVIFGESDGFPGLTVDRFSDILVAQTASYGMEKLKPLIFPLIVKTLRDDGQVIRGLYERNDLPARALEGLQESKGWFPLPCETEPESALTEICENGIIYAVDVENGQKTGFFLDQKYNRAAVGKLAKGRRVLDCFTHTGSFALNAARGGAEHVTAVDVSETAVEMARRNGEHNGLSDRMDFVRADVFDLLPRLAAEGRRDYDLIILDPPAFTKSRATSDSAYRGYKEINYRAMALLPRGGYLATASCSHFMPVARFEEMLRAAAHDAGRELKEVEVRKQAPDHPILWNVPETEYLKFYIFQVI